MEQITLETLKRQFPRSGNALYAMTGYIPMNYFVANEKAIRAAMAVRGGLRVWYRGPRPQQSWGKASATLRRNATHAVIYHRA